MRSIICILRFLPTDSCASRSFCALCIAFCALDSSGIIPDVSVDRRRSSSASSVKEESSAVPVMDVVRRREREPPPPFGVLGSSSSVAKCAIFFFSFSTVPGRCIVRVDALSWLTTALPAGFVAERGCCSLTSDSDCRRAVGAVTMTTLRGEA